MKRIVVVGLNHKVAPVEVRETLAFNKRSLEEALARYRSGNGAHPYGAEGVILSTCNRLEVYTVASCRDEGYEAVCRLLEDCHGEPREAFEPYLYTYADAEAVEHLFSVAAGLDSMVLGEHEVLGQVTDAMETGLSLGAAGKVLAALFRHAIEAGKRARTETNISQGVTSIGHVAVDLAEDVFGDLSACRVLVIGAGEMAELTVEALVGAGAEDLSILNRTRARAERLATQFDARALGWERMDQALSWADIVITSTAAPHAIVHPENVRQAMVARRDRPLFLIDIAVPRDAEPEVGDLDDVYLYDIDDLQAVVEESKTRRRQEVPRVETIIGQVQEEFLSWHRSLDVVPTIVDLRREIHDLRQAEVERALRRVNGLSEREREIIQAMTKRLVNKILHHPTVCLKEHANCDDGYHYAEVARDLFGLSGNGHGGNGNVKEHAT
jgi:glutamyl-tRNA reductase